MSPLFAMTKELFWRNGWVLLAGVIGASLFPLLLVGALGNHVGGIENLDMSISPFITMHLMLVEIGALMMAAAIFVSQGEVSQHWTYPISNVQLALWSLITTMVYCALGTAVVMSGVNFFCCLNWPVCGNALFMAIAVGSLQASLWYFQESNQIPVGTTTIVVGLNTWYKMRFGPLFDHPVHYWVFPSPVEFLQMAGMCACAMMMGISAVARHRRGDALWSLNVNQWSDRIESLVMSFSRSGPRFSSSTAAQFAIEWRRSGWVLPALTAIILGVAMAICSVVMVYAKTADERSRIHAEFFEGLLSGALLSVGLGVAGGIVVSRRDGHTEGQGIGIELGTFLASRPITSGDLGRVIRHIAFKSFAFMWCVASLVALLWYGSILIAGSTVPWQNMAARGMRLVEYLGGSLLLSWCTMGNSTALFLTGREKWIVRMFWGIFCIVPAAISFGPFVFSVDLWQRLLVAGWFLLGIAAVVFTTWSLWAALKQRLIDRREVVLAYGIWGMLVAVCAVLFLFQAIGTSQMAVAHPLTAISLTIGFASLAVAPIATIPLAIQFNRVR